jgi:hypothetical protein
MAVINGLASGDASERPGSVEGFTQVMLEFVIGELSCLITAPDQVVARLGLGVESIDERPQTPADPVAHNRVADLSTDRVRHAHTGRVRDIGNETNSK